MKLVRLISISDNNFKIAWNLYENAFPIEERRLLNAQASVMKNQHYHFDIIIDNNKFIGLLLWWDLKTHRYIDHFAVKEQHRNKGFGKLILEKFKDLNSKPIILEVELPNSKINKRRIKFYQRIGFHLNQHYYEIPPFIEGEPSIQLLIMSYPTSLTIKDIDYFTKTYHPIIFEE